MDIIKILKQKLFSIDQIKKLALENSVEYGVARIMFNSGNGLLTVEEARKISELITSANVPLLLIQDALNNDISILNGSSSLDDLYLKISEAATDVDLDKKYPYIYAQYYYGVTLCELMEKGCTLENAKKIFDMKIKIHMRKNNISEFVAMADLLYFGSVEAAKIYERAYQKYEYNCEGYGVVKNELLTSDEYKTVTINGITLVSKTEEGLSRLLEVVKSSYATGDKDFLESLSFYSEEHDLIVTDFSLNDSFNNSHYNDVYKMIFLDNIFDDIEILKNCFFHEAGHFLDYVNANNYSSVDDKEISALFIGIIEKVNISDVILKWNYFEKNMAGKYTSDEKMLEKWEAEIRSKYSDCDEETIKQFLEQKIMYEWERYIISVRCLSDIFDAVKNGWIYTLSGSCGHGIKYYSDDKYRYRETIANIAAIYNSGGIDVLYYVLGEDLTEHIISIYSGFIINPQSIYSSPISSKSVSLDELGGSFKHR